MNNKEQERSPDKIRLNSKDWGWVAVNIGMGIGAGIVFLPVQAGLVGLWTFLAAIAISYPALYLFQELFINTLAEAPECDDYPTVISEYLGEKWGIAIGFLYFIMLVIWVFVYSETITNDSASYLQTYGITQNSLSGSHLYSLIIIIFMVFLAFTSKTLLFYLSKILVVIILFLITTLAILIIRYWDINNIMEIQSFWQMGRDVIVTLPFAMTSILFLQSLSPTVTAIRSRSHSKEEARKRSIKIMRTSFTILAVIVFFFALSCTLAVSHDEASLAFANNTSFLAIMAQHMPGKTVPLIGVAISILAVMTSFFGVLLGFHEACVGLSLHIFWKNTRKELINKKRLSLFITLFTIFIAWIATIINFPILYFTTICSPIFGIIGCIIPVILVFRIKSLGQYRNVAAYIVLLTGILLVISPVFAFL